MCRTYLSVIYRSIGLFVYLTYLFTYPSVCVCFYAQLNVSTYVPMSVPMSRYRKWTRTGMYFSLYSCMCRIVYAYIIYIIYSTMSGMWNCRCPGPLHNRGGLEESSVPNEQRSMEVGSWKETLVHLACGSQNPEHWHIMGFVISVAVKNTSSQPCRHKIYTKDLQKNLHKQWLCTNGICMYMSCICHVPCAFTSNVMVSVVVLRSLAIAYKQHQSRVQKSLELQTFCLLKSTTPRFILKYFATWSSEQMYPRFLSWISKWRVLQQTQSSQCQSFKRIRRSDSSIAKKTPYWQANLEATRIEAKGTIWEIIIVKLSNSRKCN